MEINIISFNIRCCDDPSGNSIAERAPRLNKIITPYDADIIGFQEHRPIWEPFINEYFNEKYDMFIKCRSQGRDMESTPILWKKDKFDCIKTGYFWLSDTPEVESKGWDEKYNCFRMCVYVILKDKNTEKLFTVMNTHFGFGDNCQTKSADLIYNYSQKVSDHPTFVIGDFNMTPDSVGYKHMTKSLTDVNAVTAKDLRTTFHGYNPQKINDQHIDFCFINDKFTPLDQKIIDETVDNMFPSDHYGLNIKLEI